MKSESDNIELRSPKVRNIIGQVPPRIIRIGTLIVFLIITGLLACSYWIKYDYAIKTEAIAIHHSDTIFVKIKLSLSDAKKIKIGNKVILNFNNIPNLLHKQIITAVQYIPNKVVVSNAGGFVVLQIRLGSKKMITYDPVIDIEDGVILNAEIIVDKMSLIERIFLDNPK